MTENELRSRIEDLEIRLMHQEAALEELSRASVSQEQMLSAQTELIRRLEQQLRSLTPSPLASPDEETPPPHY